MAYRPELQSCVRAGSSGGGSQATLRKLADLGNVDRRSEASQGPLNLGSLVCEERLPAVRQVTLRRQLPAPPHLRLTEREDDPHGKGAPGRGIRKRP